jgi:aryl sulfotransferase
MNASRSLVWLASYPKSGNTWLRMLLESVRKGGAAVDINALEQRSPQPSDRALFDAALGLGGSDLTPAEADEARPRALELFAADLKEPVLLKVHDAWRRTAEGRELFPRALTRASVYVARDPRDVAVSFAHHTGKDLDTAIGQMADAAMTWTPAGRTLARFLPQVLDSWSGHAESWLDRSGHDPLLLRYEDLLADPLSGARALCARLGWTPADSVLRAAVEHTRFERLAAQEKVAGFVERSGPGRVFFRKGVAGGWKDVLTPQQSARIERDHGPMMRRLGYLENAR